MSKTMNFVFHLLIISLYTIYPIVARGKLSCTQIISMNECIGEVKLRVVIRDFLFFPKRNLAHTFFDFLN